MIFKDGYVPRKTVVITAPVDADHQMTWTFTDTEPYMFVCIRAVLQTLTRGTPDWVTVKEWPTPKKDEFITDAMKPTPDIINKAMDRFSDLIRYLGPGACRE